MEEIRISYELQNIMYIASNDFLQSGPQSCADRTEEYYKDSDFFFNNVECNEIYADVEAA